MLWIQRLIALSQVAGGALLIGVEFAARRAGASLPAWHIALAVVLAVWSAVAGLLLWQGSPLECVSKRTLAVAQEDQ